MFHNGLPANWELVEAMIGHCLVHRRWNMAFLLGLGFDCMLRTSEVLLVTREHFLVNRDGSKASLVIPTSKTSAGNPQVLHVTDKVLLWLATKLQGSKRRSRPLWRASPFNFRKTFDLILNDLGFSPGSYVPYALRRGGATHHFLAHHNLDSTVARGRWSCAKTAKIYVDSGTAQLAELSWTVKQSKLVRKYRLKGASVRLRQ